MASFEIESRMDGGVLVVSLSGRLNAASAPQAKEAMKRLIAGGGASMVADLSRLAFIDSSGLAALVAAYKAAVEAGGRLRIAGASAQVASVFALTALDRVFESYPDAGSAVAAFSTRD